MSTRVDNRGYDEQRTVRASSLYGDSEWSGIASGGAASSKPPSSAIPSFALPVSTGISSVPANATPIQSSAPVSSTVASSSLTTTPILTSMPASQTNASTGSTHSTSTARGSVTSARPTTRVTFTATPRTTRPSAGPSASLGPPNAHRSVPVRVSHTQRRPQVTAVNSAVMQTGSQVSTSLNPAGHLPRSMPQNQYSAPPLAEPWRQLARVSIPTFKGDKRTYEAFRATFMACVDSAPASPEYKLLQLRQYLGGEALAAIERLGFSPAAYTAAIDLLNRKYGGERRRVALQVEELDRMGTVNANQPKDMERFADLLQVAVVNLKDAGRTSELQSGTFYAKLLQKFTMPTVTRYHRWRYEQQRRESVISLLDWVSLESEFMIMSTEAVNGLSEESGRRSQPPPSARPWKQAAGNQLRARTYYTAPATASSCASCKGHHPIWKCAAFKAINAAERWKIAKGKNLCYRCLSSDHLGKDCPRDKACGKDGCAQHHHYLLHTDRAVAAPRRESSAQAPVDTTTSQESTHVTDAIKVTEEESAMISSSCSSQSAVALRTIPVRLSNGTGSSIIVNALLDDASTRTYVSNQVAGTLNLDGPKRTLIIGKLNGQEETIQTRLVSCTISDLDDAMTSELSACTVEKPAGRLKATKWQDVQHQRNHLQHICFPMMPLKRGIDILIGADHPELHLALQEKQGAAGEPTARLTPLGWTCVGQVAKDTSQSSTTLATYTFLSMGAVHEDVTRSLEQLWKMEEFNAANTPRLTMEEKKAQGVVDASIRQTNGLYEEEISWRDGRPTSLPDNHEMAEKRLAQLMKRLDKDPVVDKAYRDVIDGYVTKGYVRKVPVDEVKPSVQ